VRRGFSVRVPVQGGLRRAPTVNVNSLANKRKGNKNGTQTQRG
jgi:hypothetical protein